MATFAPVRSAFNPALPQNFEELGIPESLVLDLVLRRMLIEGYSSLAESQPLLAPVRPDRRSAFSSTCARSSWSKSRA